MTTEIFIEETLPQNMYVVILCLCMAISIEVSDLHVQFLKKNFSFTFFKQARKSSFSQLFLPTLKRSNLLVFIFIFIFFFFFSLPQSVSFVKQTLLVLKSVSVMFDVRLII